VRETENNLNITIDIPEEPAICNIKPSTPKMRTGDSTAHLPDIPHHIPKDQLPLPSWLWEPEKNVTGPASLVCSNK
jgi:hypothetical protein